MSAAIPNPPIFLKPMGRTGGTLFVTMLDAHPNLAMSYEIYEDRLLSETGAPLSLDRVITDFHTSPHANKDQGKWIRSLPDKNLQTFVFRACRAGLSAADVLDEFESFARDHRNLETLDDRLDLIDRLMIRKMLNTSKQYWGGKARVNLRALHRRHPAAKYFAMIRDGRDVLASMLNTGSFNTNAQRAAEEWADHIRSFREFARASGVHAMELPYEKLIHEPEATLRLVCGFLEVPFHHSMIQYQEHSPALLKNPYGHLSHKQISQGINDQSIGRWRRDLSREQLCAFSSVAGDLLGELGYD